MRLTVGLIIILLGILAAVPISAQAQKGGAAGDVSESPPSGLLSASAADSVAPFTLASRVFLSDRDVMDCISGQRCVFFPDRRGQQAVAFQSSVSVDPASGVFDQEPLTPSSRPPAPVGVKDAPPDVPAPDGTRPEFKGKVPAKEPGFAWGSAIGQSLLFLGIQHGIRFAFDPPTRHALSGPFWKDYVSSLASIKTWDDNNPAFINYLGHPMQGAVTAYFQIQNDPKGKSQGFNSSGAYWNSRLKALGWSAGYSAFFELGFPISEAAVGNLGIKRPATSPKMGYVDLVITPTLGTVWVIAEDAVDMYLVRFIERKTQNKTWRAIARSVLNPMRTAANVLRFKYPWYRDDLSR